MLKDTPVVLVVGKRDVGKTTLISLIIPLLKKKGYRVGTIKFNIPFFEMDHEGKDTYKYYQAGADVVSISSPEKLAIIKRVNRKSPSIQDIVEQNYQDVDVVLVEGYKKWKYPYIEISLSRRQKRTSDRECKSYKNIVITAKHGSSMPLFDKNDLINVMKFIELRIN